LLQEIITVKSGTRRITPKIFVAVIFDGHLLGTTSRAGTLQPDAGLNPHLAAWPENFETEQ
jgi:hypothetical protein